MAEYIEREALLEEINEKISNIAFTSPYQREVEAIVIGMERARDSVEDAPAADVAPVVHGRWGDPVKVDADNNGYKCSECGEFGAPCWNYCPDCGARMDGE